MCRGHFRRWIEQLEFRVQIRQGLAQNLLVAGILARGQLSCDSGTRKLQILSVAQQLDLFGAQLWFAICGLFAGGGFDLGFDRLTFPASRHNSIMDYFEI